jgi:phospholipase/carboxylesterase
MPAWYDIQAMDLERKVDEVQLRRSAEAVRALVAREQARDIRCERIVIAGFSQGGAVGFELALSHPHALGGLLAMSTYFATRRSVARHPANAALPIAIHHGSADPLVPESLGHDSARQLREWGYPVEYRSYPMEHAVCPAQVRDIGAWLSARFA